MYFELRGCGGRHLPMLLTWLDCRVCSGLHTRVEFISTFSHGTGKEFYRLADKKGTEFIELPFLT